MCRIVSKLHLSCVQSAQFIIISMYRGDVPVLHKNCLCILDKVSQLIV